MLIKLFQMSIPNIYIGLSVLFVLLKFSNSAAVRGLGDRCSISDGTEDEGVCTHRNNCSIPCGKKEEQLKYCDDRRQIVCCPVSKPNRRISALKCEEYKENACELVFTSNLPNSNDPPRKVSDCTFTSSALIAGGVRADPKEFPHMALIGYGEPVVAWKCGGTLISEQFVLTAAHCLMGSTSLVVRLGEYDISDPNETTHVDYTSIEAIEYPDYHDKIYKHDIALLKLDRIVEFNSGIRPACLPAEHPIKDLKALATGWGKGHPTEQKSSVLMKVTLDMFANKECNDIRATLNSYLSDDKYQEDEYQICAGNVTAIKNTCAGDSGGPLQIYHETQHCSYIVTGVTSFGSSWSCDQLGVAGVYTRVYPYIDWIESHVWNVSESKNN